MSKGRGPISAPSHATPKSDTRQLVNVIAEAEYFRSPLTAQDTRHQMTEVRMTQLTRVQECEFMLEKYHESGNPIWAWNAVGLWASAQARGTLEFYPAPPDLCAFLARMSSNILSLANGYPPTEYRDGEPEPGGVRQLAGAIDPVLKSGDSAKAAELLPEALFVRGGGWNAFREWHKTQDGLQLQFEKDHHQAKTGSGQKAQDLLMEKLKTEEESVLRRRLKGGRGKKSPYPIVRS